MLSQYLRLVLALLVFQIFITQVIKYSVEDVLVPNTPVRRIGNELYRPAAAGAGLDVDVEDARSA